MLNNRISIIILIIVPFVYLFPHTFQFIEMGNDFELLYYSYKKYIFEFIQVGHFPLWSPSESLGYSLIFNPFAQYFYPLSWILYFICFLIGDLTKHTYLLYTIFGISIYNIGQYLWLRRLNIDIKYCLIATLITCFGLKLNEILRFPNAVHTICWFPWILYGMTISIKISNKIKSSLILFLSSILILTAGYPYYILYGFILFSSYFIFISFKKVKLTIYKKEEIQNNFIFFLNNSIPPILALIIVLPWISGVTEIMEITRDRNLNDINFSFSHSSNFIDQLGSWIFPPVSYAEGYYYFGSVVTLIIIFYISNFFLDKNKEGLEKYFLFFFIIFFIFSYQFAASKDSFLFKILWNNIDFIKNFREFSRINIVLIPLFSVIISFSIKKLIEKKYNFNFVLTVFITTVLILFLQLYLIEYSNYDNKYWHEWQGRRLLQASNDVGFLKFFFVSYNNYLYSAFFIFSLVTLILVKKYYLEFLAPIFIISLIVCELFVLANIQWAIPHKYYDNNNYNKLSKKPLSDLRNSFSTSRIATVVKGNTYFRNLRKYNVNYFDNFGIDKHTKLFDKYFKRMGIFREEIDLESREKINFLWGKGNNDQKVFFSKSIDHKSINSLVDDLLENKENFNNEIKIDLEKYDGDKIEISFNAEKSGYIIFLDNWSPGWKVFVNDEEKSIKKALGTYKSVKVSIGNNKINFIYDPW